MERIKTRKTILVIAACLFSFSLFAISACTQQEQSSEPQTAENKTEEQVKEELLVIGKETDSALKLEVENVTGKDIAGLAVKLSTVEAYPASLMTTGQKFEVGKKALICIDPADTSAGTSSGSDVVLRLLYNVQITFSDNEVVELHAINFAGLKDTKLCLSKENIAYIEYTNESGKTESTLETEKALKVEAEAATVAAAEAEAAAQAQATAEAEAAAAAEAAATEAANSNQYDYSYGNTDNSGSSSGSQSEDQCVDDLILR